MKKLMTVFGFEFMSYAKSKSFVITTVVLAVVLGAATFLPRVIDLSDALGIESEEKTESIRESGEKKKFGIADRTGEISDFSMFEKAFEDTEFVVFPSEEELKKAVKAGDASEGEQTEKGDTEAVEAGFYIMDDLTYRYYVMNREMSDENTAIFDEVLATLHKQKYCASHGLDYDKFVAEYDAPVKCEEKILGKDASMNFWYCYALVIIIFMVIIMYGTMIATSVTIEKSNRSIEVLVTSVDSKYLLFGKVFAGASAAILQVGLILSAALIGYSINSDAWGNKLDMLLRIPPEVIESFVVFGIGGFVFYAFLYSAMGALVSKTEDVSRSASSLQMLVMAVYFIVLFQLENTEGMLMKICSFLPFSSYCAMFVRIGMGQVAIWEIITSALILIVSIVLVGILATKIYRMGTLRYGNPIKFMRALKDIRG